MSFPRMESLILTLGLSRVIKRNQNILENYRLNTLTKCYLHTEIMCADRVDFFAHCSYYMYIYVGVLYNKDTLHLLFIYV